jgi:hypothetical protein
MKRVYLDQKDWINLSRANRGLKSGEPFIEALRVARAAVSDGTVSFPLSEVHYMEVYRRRDWKSRHRLADLMAELSRFNTIAPPQAIVPAEIDLALAASFPDKATTPRPLKVFGVGLRHAAADDSMRFQIEPADIPDEATRRAFEAAMSEEWELAMLRGPALDTALPTPPVEYAYQRSEEALSKRLEQDQRGRGDRLRTAMVAIGLVDIQEPLVEALRRAGIKLEELLTLGEEGLTDLLQAVRSRWVLAAMRRDAHARKHHEVNDLRDLAALGIAVAYCDIVVTEKQWVHVLKQARIDALMNTTLLSSVSQLPDALP